ncbi:65-kDa microtubule-associated protein 1-like isoform X2 [Vigna unguiculata]|uniref:65-kDa microtubule-associated protein 1-like isoform X1 n=1 Tax=Vigna unguiculata TaxID=3917 RepID=UPI001015DA28|nr:65-kDa microtubule-associated protein 1-like isoform X1 [Vigna unguiculata]XP_027926370.1 65-kDa microtubule-associated protein 1-like isoform X1 [Vigna unguiculata]XP_027926371.1 65-kDa microtubule-associated protein 1-like isoform X1 [Vigna unguiculata]XP_027926372.1 65-kDa microtubule-associated protein 1-like isoform X1 [Vigna unguiculata]XP_027926373.1 65-kDa microtubule-associated protein 1-like isoform X2 [Vigna unguiculata]
MFALVLSFGLLLTALRSRKARSWHYGSVADYLSLSFWDEIGESNNDRDNMLLQLEQECLDIYHKRVEETRKHKADMYQWLADAEAQATNIVSSIGESTVLPRKQSPDLKKHKCIRAFLDATECLYKTQKLAGKPAGIISNTRYQGGQEETTM